MPRKKFCKCGKRVEEGNSTFRCNSCTAYDNELCSKPRPTMKQPHDDINFIFQSWLNDKCAELLKFKMLGAVRIDKKDKKHVAVVIYLSASENKLNESLMIKALCQVISHEMLHKAVYLNDYNFNDSKSMDDGLMSRLEKEGFL
ncbi:MAG: hypothetical protein IMZ52_08665 [Actinobacteria bacterium]|nr:hypothetical protein [Actinomycetota bacterium]MBE3121488.1 hypothetical protein [Thermoplasmata archaeon]